MICESADPGKKMLGCVSSIYFNTKPTTNMDEKKNEPKEILNANGC